MDALALTSLSAVVVGREADQAPIDPAARLAQWLQSLGANTRRAYVRDLTAFAAHHGEPTPGVMVNRIVGMTRARALVLVEAFRDAEIARGVGSATINRRLASINGALRALHRADLGPGRVDIPNMKREARKDTRGPGVVKVAGVLDDLAESAKPIDIRDNAILRLAAQRGLRRSEIAGLRLEDLALDAGEIRVLRKGNRERVAVKLPAACVVALRAWLAIRPDVTCNAAFLQMGRKDKGNPLSDDGVFRLVRKHGASIGGTWRPHGLRHTAVTAVLRHTRNIESARVFAGHSSVSTTQTYLDDAGELEAEAVGAMDQAF